MNRLRFLLSYMILELKKIRHALPQLLIGTIVLMMIISFIAFCGVTFLYPDSSFDQVQIAIILPDNADSSRSVIDLVGNLNPAKELFSFYITDKKSAYADLANEKAIAIMIIPNNMIDEILDGTNSPVQIIFAKSSSLSTMLLQELTSAGAKILSSAQSDIYTITDLYLTEGLQDYLAEAYDILNRSNLHYVLARDRIFQNRNSSATGSLSISTYYTASAILLILFLFGNVCSTFLTNEPKAFLQRTRSLLLPNYFIILIQWFCTYLVYYGILILLFLILFLLGHSDFPIIIPSSMSLSSCALVIAFISSYTVMIYRITPTLGTGIFILTISTLLFLFLSGAFIPTAFFPDSLIPISRYSPFTASFYKMGEILTGVSSPQYDRRLLLSSIFFSWIAKIGYGYRIRKYH